MECVEGNTLVRHNRLMYAADGQAVPGKKGLLAPGHWDIGDEFSSDPPDGNVDWLIVTLVTIVSVVLVVSVVIRHFFGYFDC